MVLLGSAFSVGVFTTRQLKIYFGINSWCAASLKRSTAALLEEGRSAHCTAGHFSPPVSHT